MARSGRKCESVILDSERTDRRNRNNRAPVFSRSARRFGSVQQFGSYSEAERKLHVTRRAPLTVWWFVRSRAVQIMAGTLLILMLLGNVCVSLYVYFQPEQQIAREINSSGGRIGFDSFGPNWISWRIRHRLQLWDRITSVSFSGTDVTDADWERLKKLRHLHALDLRDAQVSDADLKEISGSPTLQMLSLDNTQVTDAGLEHLQGLPSLRRLFLGNTQVTDAGLEHLKKVPTLRDVYLNDTQIGDTGLEHLTWLPALGTLDLANTRVTDAGLGYLKWDRWLKSLELIDLTGTRTTEAGRALLRDAKHCQVYPNPSGSQPYGSLAARAMVKPHREPLSQRWFVRTCLGRIWGCLRWIWASTRWIVIGTVLMVTNCFAVGVYNSYSLKQQIAPEFESDVSKP